MKTKKSPLRVVKSDNGQQTDLQKVCLEIRQAVEQLAAACLFSDN